MSRLSTQIVRVYGMESCAEQSPRERSRLRGILEQHLFVLLTQHLDQIRAYCSEVEVLRRWVGLHGCCEDLLDSLLAGFSKSDTSRGKQKPHCCRWIQQERA